MRVLLKSCESVKCIERWASRCHACFVYHRRSTYAQRMHAALGRDEGMQVSFREFDASNLWVSCD
eukprot:3859593-Pyramimonas_sp.AAC.1